MAWRERHSPALHSFLWILYFNIPTPEQPPVSASKNKSESTGKKRMLRIISNPLLRCAPPHVDSGGNRLSESNGSCKKEKNNSSNELLPDNSRWDEYAGIDYSCPSRYTCGCAHSFSFFSRPHSTSALAHSRLFNEENSIALMSQQKGKCIHAFACRNLIRSQSQLK